MSMLEQVGGRFSTPPEDTTGFFTREEQVHFSDNDRRAYRRELARDRIKKRRVND